MVVKIISPRKSQKPGVENDLRKALCQEPLLAFLHATSRLYLKISSEQLSMAIIRFDLSED